MNALQDTRVVVADDHPIILLAITDTLQALPGFKVIATVGSGQELLEVLTQQECDLIVTDLTMQQTQPDEDGLRLIARLRRLYANLPIVVFTMLTNTGILHQLVQLGVTGLVGKDENLSALERICIRSLAGKAPCLSPGVQARLASVGNAPSSMHSASLLTPKELEVIRLFSRGVSLTEIARQLSRSITTVATQKRSAMRKLNVTTNADLVTYANEQGLV